MKRFWILKAILIGTLAVLAFSLLVMVLWNWLVPALFNGPTIDLWQALGLLVLSKILFGGFGKGGWGGGHDARKRAWRKKFEEKWASMPPEEQERFKYSFRNCGSRWPETQQQEPTIQHV